MRRATFPFQWMVAAMFSLATVSISNASTLGLDVTSNTTVAFPGEYDNAGWQFSVNAPVTVDGLGFFDVNPTGLGQGHQVGLWDNNGTLLVQATVSSASSPIASASTAGQWLFESIGPLVLQPGTYVTSAYFPNHSDALLLNPTFVTDPQIVFLASRISTNGKFAEPGPYGGIGAAIYGANIRLQTPPAVPEPASLLLLGFGLTTLAAGSRKIEAARRDGRVV